MKPAKLLIASFLAAFISFAPVATHADATQDNPDFVVNGDPAAIPNALEPAAGDKTTKPTAAPDPTENNTKGNPNTDRPATNADINTEAPTTLNPTEGRSSPSGGPTY